MPSGTAPSRSTWPLSSSRMSAAWRSVGSFQTLGYGVKSPNPPPPLSKPLCAVGNTACGNIKMPSRNWPSTRIEGLRGARFILTDMVGLGKTLQLAMAGMLMALYGTRPMLILAPKTLVWQWQDEMQNMLALPSDGQTMGG
jgi:hypothetical protein